MEIYLDNAATSHPKPACTLRAVQDAMTRFNANPGRAGHTRSLAAGRLVLEARETLARALGARDPFCVVHAFNCTDALNLAIKGCLKRGDHVVSTMLEHNSVLRVLMEKQKRGEIAVTLVRPRGYFVDARDVQRALRPNTRLIAVTHASNVTGAVQPVEEICQLARRKGVLSLVDGAQRLGGAPVDVKAMGCSLYAFPGHKSLLGPTGTGGLYIEPGLALDTVREGGTGSSSDSMLQPKDPPERYEAGTLNLAGIAGLKAGARYVQERLLAIHARERELADQLYRGARALPGAVVYAPAEPAARAGIVSLNLGDLSSSELADALDRAGICARGGLHCAPGAHEALGTLRRGAVRLSVGHATTPEEIEQTLRVLREIAREA